VLRGSLPLMGDLASQEFAAGEPKAIGLAARQPLPTSAARQEYPVATETILFPLLAYNG
jgi:hypothetical protein